MNIKKNIKMNKHKVLNSKLLNLNFSEIVNNFYNADAGVSDDGIPILNWYLHAFNAVPNAFILEVMLDTEDFLKKYEKNIIYKIMRFNIDTQKEYVWEAVVELDNLGTVVVISDGGYRIKQNKFIASFHALYKEETVALKEFKEFIKTLMINTTKKPEINIICKNYDGFYLQSFKPKVPIIDFDCHYNEDFKPINDLIIEKLNKNNSQGIVLLHGKPGTGKTNYIRYVVSNIIKKTILYIPPDMATELASPLFIPFLVTVPNSILIIEDAENVLVKRSGQHNQAIANILNLSDGLLSDYLNIQIIATFNTDLSNIDDALLRKGRLIAKYNFKELTADKVEKLAKKLKINNIGDKANTLAEIYNNSDINFSKSKETIGFNLLLE